MPPPVPCSRVARTRVIVEAAVGATAVPAVATGVRRVSPTVTVLARLVVAAVHRIRRWHALQRQAAGSAWTSADVPGPRRVVAEAVRRAGTVHSPRQLPVVRVEQLHQVLVTLGLCPHACVETTLPGQKERERKRERGESEREIRLDWIRLDQI